MTTRRGRPTQAEAKALDLTVRNAAVATFIQSGYDGATMEAIAKAAGITKRSLYARYADKHALFVDVIPWALSRFEDDRSDVFLKEQDLETALVAVGRAALKRAVNPENVRLKRIAMNEGGRFPEFNVTAESMMWSGRQRVVTELLRRHEANGEIKVDDVELAAEHFLAMVEALPARFADFGIYRSKAQNERHLQQAVSLFLRGVVPR
ncbi:TetR/AcrR family transcriptional regulator [Mycolicibacterium peregrinum]|uniref:TetR/AcrR family transcriptional regulator n=1 Tax=Mycolicibacterium peregrinum TaxID=43304 RepID=A0A4Z0HQ21_MYCPR|nr:TetR/AcrR family transcriptional regulator [Mycolicibacterium peregrinum]TGB43086.1 TetR/AcrR family transcriptional regulator [Mycolicibacterium peregrinum]TGB44143.1 TetR/AcrR family transcriptional regulator [Mycolicibacterium peregrinum]